MLSYIGREDEHHQFEKHLESGKAQLGILYGRRRVGKSTLLKKFIKPKTDIYFEGLQKASLQKQIDHFMDQLSDQTGSMKIVANNWNDAFKALSLFIQKGKHYIVFDEFPWMASGKTELVSLLKFYWDNQWKNNPHLTLVLCGSIASFMLKHLVHSHSLHNRKTFEIKLEALPAYEAKKFFKGYRSDFEVLKFLMIFGGIPKYLEQLDPKKSLFTNINELCFQKNCFFFNEFKTLFKEQFKVINSYEKIVRFLSKKSSSKEELATLLKQKGGGGLTQYIENLEQADFIRNFKPAAPKGETNRTRRIYLWDEWLKFYFTYMEPNLHLISQNTKQGLFENLSAKSFENYCGLAFEKLCLKNISSVLANLEIPLHQVKRYGPFFRQAPRNKKRNKTAGLQIDILIERTGHILTLVECKFSSSPVGVSVIKEMDQKIALLKAGKTYSIEKVLIAPGGVTEDLEESGYFHKILGAEAVLETS